MADTVIVDDTNPSIKYSGTWSGLEGTQGAYNNTSHGVLAGSSGTTLSFVFRGTSVAVYGTVDHLGQAFGVRAPSSSYDVDGAQSSTFVPDLETTTQFKKQFYQAQSLSDGEHTLNVAVRVLDHLGASFWLDYIEYTPTFDKAPDANPPSLPGSSDTTLLASPPTASDVLATFTTRPISTTTPSSTGTESGNKFPTNTRNNTSEISGSSASSGGAHSLTDSSSTTSTPIAHTPSTATAGPKSGLSVGAIIGAVIGGLFLLFLLLTALYLWRRKRRNDSNSILRAHAYPKEMVSAAPLRNTFDKKSIPFDFGPVSPSSLSDGPVITREILTDRNSIRHFGRVTATDPPEYRSLENTLYSDTDRTSAQFFAI